METLVALVVCQVRVDVSFWVMILGLAVKESILGAVAGAAIK
jgi:hypothetical protein